MMNNAPEQIFLPSSSGTQDQPGLPKSGNGPQPVNLDSVEEFSKVCRVCAAVSELVMPIFSGEGLQNNLADKIHKHLPIKVLESDSPGLPVVVCYQCASTLLATHELVQCAAQADAALRTRSAALAAAAAAAAAARRKEESLRVAQERDTADGTAQTGTERRCAFCPTRLPRAQYRAHLERRHAALVFHCAECDRYLSRRVLLLHMTAHAAHYDAAAQEAERQARPDLPPPDPTPAQQLASALQSLLWIAPGVRAPLPAPNVKLEAPDRSDAIKPEALAKPETSLRCNTEGDIQNEAQNANIPPAQPTPVTPAPDLTRTASIRSPVSPPASEVTPTAPSNPPVILSAVTVPTPTAASPAGVTASLPETAIAPTGIRDEFSDHSDAESDFAPIPDSVFSAIEDPPDVIPTAPEAKDEEVGAKAGRKRERACPHCDKKYSAASSYFYHLKYFHLRSREHSCTVCGASFGTRGTLREHARLHSSERSLQCACCGKGFRSKAGLYIHSQTHGGGKAKEWACSECGRAFRWRAQLRRHVARHAGARAHKCPQPRCPRAFSVHADLLRHARTHTRPPARLPCPAPGCAATFAQPRYLRAHLTKKHPTAAAS